MSGVEKKIKRVERSIDFMERGMRGELSASQCADYIAWVAKFHKVPKNVWEPLCERLTELFESDMDIYF